MEGRAIQTEALLLRLDVARQRMGANAIIATDGDGTLWAGDIGDALFETLLAERGVRQQAAGMLRDEAQRFGVAVSDQATPTEVAATLLESYRTGGYAEDRAFAMMAWSFAGWTEEELAVFSRRVLHDFGFENALREELKVVLQWAAEKAVP
ncbi:MAG: haloacid dehalogenase-like hydrolase, partial [Polyangiaceae bacterium]